ncbi:MAG TPA: winged helix-turn-helix domain-containing protein [Solirubrobacteraceae bacterium]|jgi:predicted transcriptional regulator|nr:winged helix-turn-helix domain-containing protein [Solirubrobacteraceae bacterium]
MQPPNRDGWPQPPALPALDLLADHMRQRIVWALAHQPRTPTRLAHALGCSQPLVSKHLRILRAAGLVESRRHPRDRRVHIYDIRREPFSNIEDWLYAIQRNYRRRHPPPTDPYTWN